MFARFSMLLRGAAALLYDPTAFVQADLALGHLPASPVSAQPPLQLNQRRHGALTRLAKRRQASAAEERQAERAADRLRGRLLQKRGLAALRVAAEAAHRSDLRADTQRQKTTYLRAAAAWAAWRGAATRQRRLTALAGEATALRRSTLAARALAALQRHVAARRAKRHAAATADSFAQFCRLVNALDAWRAAMAACALRRQLLAAAVLHWAARLCGAAIAAWREYAAARQRKLALAELADVHRRRRCLAASLAAWRGAVLRLAELRAAAATTIQAALYGGTHQLAGMCLRSWQQHAGRRARLRDAAHLADRLRHYGLLAAVWRR